MHFDALLAEKTFLINAILYFFMGICESRKSKSYAVSLLICTPEVTFTRINIKEKVKLLTREMLDAIDVHNLRSKPHAGRFIRRFMEQKSQITQNYRHFVNTHNTSGTSSSTQFWSRHRQTTLCLLIEI